MLHNRGGAFWVLGPNASLRYFQVVVWSQTEKIDNKNIWFATLLSLKTKFLQNFPWRIACYNPA